MIFFNDALNLIIPFFVATIMLIITDLIFGVEAARKRVKDNPNADRVRASTALRRTINKLVEYICWLVLGATLSVAFKRDWVHYAIMALIIVNELISIIDNYFYVHGKKVTGLWRFVLKALGRKLDIDTSDIHIESLDKPEAEEHEPRPKPKPRSRKPYGNGRPE